jgi:cell wall-associated NlpC family hydrolase
MRPHRFLRLLLAIAASVAFALGRPLQSRAAATLTGPGDPPRRLATIGRANVLFGTRIVRFAKHLLGTPYHYGGMSPSSGFDCSGFVRYVYSHFGVTLPHSSFADLGLGRGVGRARLHPGDLVFFDGAGHVGIYVGGGRFIHAPHTGTVVSIASMDGWYGARFVAARRIR